MQNELVCINKLSFCTHIWLIIWLGRKLYLGDCFFGMFESIAPLSVKFHWGHWKVWWYSWFFYMYLFFLLPAPKLLGSSFYSYSIEISPIMTEDGFLLLILLGTQWALSNHTLVFPNLGSFLCYFFNNFSLFCFFLYFFLLLELLLLICWLIFTFSYFFSATFYLFCSTFWKSSSTLFSILSIEIKVVDVLFWVISFLQTPVIRGLWTGSWSGSDYNSSNSGS